MSLVVFVDFGASRIKSSLFDTASNKIVRDTQIVSPSVKSHAREKSKFEVPPEEYWVSLEKSLEVLLSDISRDQKILGIWICSEMHGFILADISGQPLTPYISWKDERAVNDGINGESTLQKLKSELLAFRDITGMNLKSGLPVVTLASLIQSNDILAQRIKESTNKIFILTLVDWLLFRGGESDPKADPTMLMGLGFHDLKSHEPSFEILDKTIGSFFKPSFVQENKSLKESLGSINVCGRRIRLYGGLGDFQVALFGAGYKNCDHAIINLGTGSQVAVPYKNNDFELAELRLMVDNSIAKVITHIPSGRALNVIASFFDQFCVDDTYSIFWEEWNSLTVDDVISSTLDCNLCLFESAWGMQSSQSSGWVGIAEGCTDVHSVISGVAKSWIKQYLKAISILDPTNSIKKVIVSGGVAHKSKFLPGAFNLMDQQRRYSLAKSQSGEETIDGLYNIMSL